MEDESINEFGDWRNIYYVHPQSEILIKHVERATQDIFYDSLKTETSDLFFLIKSEKKLDQFLGKMIKYWEQMEEFEKCSEIMKLGNELRNKWDQKRESISKLTPMERLHNWIKSSL